MEPRVVVIGFGNSLRGDDALGPRVADELRRQIADPRVEVISETALGVDLAASLAVATLAVFLDAALDGPPGGVVCRTLRPAEDTPAAAAHHLTPEELLGVTRTLYRRVPQACLLSVRGAVFDWADNELSTQVAAAVEPMIVRARTLIGEHLTPSAT
jgi:hydrogenase maturation protease